MKKKLVNYIVETPVYASVISWLKGFRFKRYEDVTMYEVVKVFIQKMSKDEIIERANAVAFNFTLAIFPGIIFLFNLTPYIHDVIPEVSQENIMDFVSNFMTADMYSTVYLTVEDIVGNARGGLLTFGAIFSLYLATNGMTSLMTAFNACYKTIEKRGFFKMRLVATLLTIMFAFVLMVSTLLLVVGNLMIDTVLTIEWLHMENHTVGLLFVSRFVILFITFFTVISIVYYYGPAVHYNWRFFSIGAITATLLALAASYAFSFYLNNFSTYNKLYGSLGVLIALMIYLEILSIILLVGYEINASIHHAHRISGIKELRHHD
jgi:membrane protein